MHFASKNRRETSNTASDSRHSRETRHSLHRSHKRERKTVPQEGRGEKTDDIAGKPTKEEHCHSQRDSQPTQKGEGNTAKIQSK